MIKVKTEKAIGKKLFHDVTGFNKKSCGAVFKRGHIIKEDDVKTLLDIGKEYVLIESPLKENMIHEEDAAKELSLLLSTPNAHWSEITEGKTTLISDIDGFYYYNKTLLNKINSIKNITISSLPNHYRVKKGTPLISCRIIPLFCEKKYIEKAKEVAKGKEITHLDSFKKIKVGIIITGNEVYYKRIQDRFEDVIKNKLLFYPHTIIGTTFCPDEKQCIINAANEMLKNKVDLIFFTGGMSVDSDDVTPKAIKAISDNFVTYGIPSQPGNMTVVSYHKNTALLGVPSAAIKCPVTVIDALLPAIFSGYKLQKKELLSLSDGGLCLKCDTCHFPCCTFGRW